MQTIVLCFLTIPDAPAGTRQVKVVKNDYAPYIATVTIKVDQTTTLTATLKNDDLEKDGLLDDEEKNGFTDGFGNRHTTDPDLIDTDGDGLSDSMEWEIGTDLWSADTDDDGHSDYEEHVDPDYDPLVYEERYGPLVASDRNANEFV